MLLKLLLGLSTLPWMVLMQTYYMNFIFNNNRYFTSSENKRKGNLSESGDGNSNKLLGLELETLEVSSVEHSHSPDTSHRHQNMRPKPSDSNTDESLEDLHRLWSINTSEKLLKTTTKKPPKLRKNKKANFLLEITTERITNWGKLKIPLRGKTEPIEKEDVEEEATEITTEMAKEDKPMWHIVVPHPDDFFDYPLAKCHEDMDLHEAFGIRLERDRGLPAKVYCNFNNSWGGPWLLMNRMELPARLHMRHWFFGYVSDDFKDMNINFLGLAHLMNNMRISMLILGQDNLDRLVYNLYDDVVISAFNDLFMLRKAHLIEANTTDLLFISVGQVMKMYSARDRTCPFKVLGSWWGGGNAYSFCVFPVNRDINRPGYMAIFIKPSPFAINNTALYDHEITTRRPWITKPNANLMALAKNNSRVYRSLMQEAFNLNKGKVEEEIERRKNIYPDIEKNRAEEAKNQSDNI